MNVLLKIRVFVVLSSLFLVSCTYQDNTYTDLPLSNVSSLPSSDVTMRITSLSNCTHQGSDELNLSSKEPVTVIVHGCFSSAGRFRSLADVYAFHGQQTVCFNYDDRERLATSSAELVKAIKELSLFLESPKIVLIGHSQGGLVARRALTKEQENVSDVSNIEIDLVTISAPFGGIEAAAHCGSKILAWLSFGLTKPICQLITGRKYQDIPANSDFISKPGNLIPSVSRHIKILTDETNTCRVYDAQGVCIEDDFVFSVDEQKQQIVDTQPRLIPLAVKAGHAEIVGNSVTIPLKLIELLQQQGLLRSTPKEVKGELAKLLANLYLSP